jgi:membrane protein DedA with SNARE-associated domain
MSKKQVPLWPPVIAAVGFAAAAVVRVMKGDGLHMPFVVLALVFAALGISMARRKRRPSSNPPTA